MDNKRTLTPEEVKNLPEGTPIIGVDPEGWHTKQPIAFVRIAPNGIDLLARRIGGKDDGQKVTAFNYRQKQWALA